jgi:hypothetical protein
MLQYYFLVSLANTSLKQRNNFIFLLMSVAVNQLLAWYRIRDTLFGDNFVEQDVKKAFELAAVCEHPLAVWLTNLFAGRDVNTPEETRQVFLGCENDARARCFAAVLGGSGDELRRAADFGDAYAQARTAERSRGEECFQWGQKSAAQGERDGFFRLGWWYQYGNGCEKDEERVKEFYLIAAELGFVKGMVYVGLLLGKFDLQRSAWLGKAAVNGSPLSFLSEMREQLRNFDYGRGGHGNVIFAIGRVLKGRNDYDKRSIFREVIQFDTFIGPANQALEFYNLQLRLYRKAVDTWTLVGIRNKAVKDIRKMIAQMIWDSREEAKYVTEKV